MHLNVLFCLCITQNPENFEYFTTWAWKVERFALLSTEGAMQKN